MNRNDPEIVSLSALEFLAREPARLERFCALTGVAGQDLARLAGDPAFLAAVLDHLLQDETLLLMFAEREQLDPAAVAACRARLPGGSGMEDCPWP